jgi:predicted nucleic acid-binding protein
VILADSSSWVEFDRGTGSMVDRRMVDLLRGSELVVAPPVLMEVLVGARDDRREAELRALLLSFPLIPFDPAQDFDNAVRIYRRCRRAGVTPRGTVDCLIAGMARRAGCALLAHDADIGRVAGVMGIEMDPASLLP